MPQSWSEKQAAKKKKEQFKDTPDPERKVSKPKIKGNEDEVASATKGQVDRDEALKKHRKYGRG